MRDKQEMALPTVVLEDYTLADGTLLVFLGLLDAKMLDPAATGKMAVWEEQVSGLLVQVSIDRTDLHGTLLHVSLSHRDRLPHWGTVKMVRDAYFGDAVDVAMILPRSADWINVHEFTFHLWQLPEKWGLH